MREFKYGVGVIAQNFLLNLLLVKMSEKSLKKADFRSKKQKDMSNDGIQFAELLYEHVFCTWNVISGFSRQRTSSSKQSNGENHATTQSTLCTKFIIRFISHKYN